jgi:hypothetical protein
VGLFSFLGKKKPAEEIQGSADRGVPMPSSQETPDIYADLPAFSEKSAGDELLPPLRPILQDTMPGISGPIPEMVGNQAPSPEEEELPVPPQFNDEETSPTEPYTVPGISAPPEIQQPDVPAIPEPPAPEQGQESVPELPGSSSRRFATGPFIRAYELRQIIKDTNDLHASIRLVQDVAEINEILQVDAAAYDRFHKSIEGLQRKLMLAERMFMKV